MSTITCINTTTAISFPLQTEEQSINTQLFLNLVADTYHTQSRCWIVKSNILKRDTYKKIRDPKTGKLKHVYDGYERIISGHKGIDWSAPSIYELAQGTQLLEKHQFAYPHKNKSTGEWIYKNLPPLVDSVLKFANSETKLLFYPCLVKKHPLRGTRYTDHGVPYRTQINYCTDDVTHARCLWVDIDGHHLPPEEISVLNLAAIDNFMELLPGYCSETGVPMPAVVNSGRGVHLYWWFTEALPLIDEQSKKLFKGWLGGANRWAAQLIQRDSVCLAAWQADASSSAVFHQMNLPGTIHPKTKTPRYVVNRYNRDYFKVESNELFDALEPFGTIQPRPAPSSITVPGFPVAKTRPSPHVVLPTEKVISIRANCAPNEQMSVTVPSKYAQKAYATGRLGRLLAWAESRRWNITNSKSASGSGREIFLFVCGAILAQQGLPALEELYEINERLKTPIGIKRVQKIAKELKDKAQT